MQDVVRTDDKLQCDPSHLCDPITMQLQNSAVCKSLVLHAE
jgi:hypothetical protein